MVGDFHQKLPRISIRVRFYIGALPLRVSDFDSLHVRDLVRDGSSSVVPVNFVQRIEKEPKVEFSGALTKVVWLDLSPKFHVVRGV